MKIDIYELDLFLKMAVLGGILFLVLFILFIVLILGKILLNI